MNGRIALGLRYRGSAYRGWQSQTDGRTVQDALQKALSQFADRPVTVTCAGRTDTGVHGLNQVVHLDPGVHRLPASWVRGGNRYLPNDIAIQLNVTTKALDEAIEKTRALAEASKGGAAAPDADFRGDVLSVDEKAGIIVFSGGVNAGVKAQRKYVVTRTTAPFYVGTVVVLDASDPKFSSGVFTPAADPSNSYPAVSASGPCAMLASAAI